MKYIFSLLMIAAFLNACGPTVELPPGTGGAGGMGGSTAESSSSSSSGQMTCDLNYVVSVCQDCKLNGCEMPKDSDEPCKRIGTIHYTDMVGCIQSVQFACPDCPNPAMAGSIINEACSACVAEITSCSMDCHKEVHGGQ